MKHRLLATAVALSLLTGCGSIPLSQKGGQPGGQFSAYAINNPSAISTIRGLPTDKNFTEEITKCSQPPALAPMAAPALIPIIGSVAKLAFDSYIDQQQRNNDRIQKAATVTYSTTTTLAQKLSDYDCILLTRFAPTDEPEATVEAQKEDPLRMVAILKLLIRPDEV